MVTSPSRPRPWTLRGGRFSKSGAGSADAGGGRRRNQIDEARTASRLHLHVLMRSEHDDIDLPNDVAGDGSFEGAATREANGEGPGRVGVRESADEDVTSSGCM